MPLPPIILFLSPFCAGLLFGLNHSDLVLTTLLVSLPLLLALFFKKRPREQMIIMAVSVGISLLGKVHVELKERAIHAQNEGLLNDLDHTGPLILEGVVEDLPVPTSKGIRMVVTLLGIKGRVALYVRGAETEYFTPGDIIHFWARLYKIQHPKTPGVFDRERWWKERGILFQGFTQYPMRCVILGHTSGHGVERLRKSLVERLEKRLSRENVPIAIALTIGNKAWIPRGLKETFLATGTGHILAVSGLHMAMVTAFFSALVAFFLLRSQRVALAIPVRGVAVVAGIGAASFYLVLSGLSPSATRAFLMVFAFSLAFLLKRELGLMDTLFFAAWVILLGDPYSIKSASFLLSFGAVFFIIWYKDWIKRGTYPSRALKIGLIAWLATLPLVSNTFHQASTVALVANLIVVPLVGLLILPLLLLLLALDPVFYHLDPITLNLWHLLDLAISSLRHLLGSLAPLGQETLVRHHFTSMEVLSYYGLLLGVGLFLRKDNGHVDLKEMATRLKRFGPYLPVAIGLGIIFFWILSLSHRDRKTHFYCLDVGQGLSQVITTPSRTVVIDAGGGDWPFDQGTMVVEPFLFEKNRYKIDYLIISHLEKDHAGGALGLLKNLDVKELIVPSAGKERSIYRRLVDIAKKKGVSIMTLEKTHKIRLDEVTTLQLFPYEGPSIPSWGLNNYSIVALLDVDGKRVLMPGDIEKGRESCFIGRPLDELSQGVEILVAPHHGSSTSSSQAFLEVIRPKYVIFSCGPHNGLGLPDPSVVDRYRAIGAQLFATGRQGTISVTFTEKGTLYNTFEAQGKAPFF